MCSVAASSASSLFLILALILGLFVRKFGTSTLGLRQQLVATSSPAPCCHSPTAHAAHVTSALCHVLMVCRSCGFSADGRAAHRGGTSWQRVALRVACHARTDTHPGRRVSGVCRCVRMWRVLLGAFCLVSLCSRLGPYQVCALPRIHSPFPEMATGADDGAWS